MRTFKKYYGIIAVAGGSHHNHVDYTLSVFEDENDCEHVLNCLNDFVESNKDRLSDSDFVLEPAMIDDNLTAMVLENSEMDEEIKPIDGKLRFIAYTETVVASK